MLCLYVIPQRQAGRKNVPLCCYFSKIADEIDNITGNPKTEATYKHQILCEATSNLILTF